MGRRRKPEDETDNEVKERHALEFVTNHASRSEKTAFNRLMDNMVSLLATLKPIEDNIIQLQLLKTPIIDDIQELRQQMIKQCVHPYDHLVALDGVVYCKFCDHKFKVNINE